ncbi:type 4 pilus major pilin [Pseudomonas gessardii]|uniref:Pilus assembly protein PilX n=1 Tax=Pseudomonas gessardii TaxID=78544 RepID=A0A7Y1MPF1_9PSED|nr:type 4 pilus major pilin [Pseudomonas gessardii]NNA95861.1 pilus assembly protein PilX [Pseudomonas gessardii]
MPTNTHHAQRGFLSLDGLFWLMLIAVALGFIVFLGYRTFGSSDVTIEQSNLGTLLANTKRLKSTTGYAVTGTDLVPSLINLEATGGMSINGATLANRWNGVVTVISNGMTFTITERNLPKAACITLASNMAKDKQTTTAINGGTAIAGEVTAVAASTSCSSDANTIAWTSY